jgi:hypothetical protein
MSKAIERQAHCLLGLLTINGDIYYYQSEDEFRHNMQQYPDAAIFYNQHPDAIRLVESLCYEDGQISIEIFQDIEGVFGLRAYQIQGKMQQPIELDFDHH